MPNYARRNYYVYHYKNGIRAARCGFVRLVTQPGHTYFLLQFSHEGDIDSDVYTFTVEKNPAWISRTFCGRGTICGQFLRLEMQISGEWTPQGLLCGTRQDFYAVCFRGELTGALPFQKPQTTTDYGCRILEHFPQIPEFSHPGLARQIQMEPKDLGLLPVKHWGLAGNPWLLQGYFTHHHLLFGQTSTGSSRYVLGVPGFYEEEKKQQAAEFGFPEFYPQKQPLSPHGFGYWIHPL